MLEHAPKLQYDGMLSIMVGDSRWETNWRIRELPWSDLVKKLSTTQRTKETVQEYQAMPKTRKGEIKDVGGFVGGLLKGGRRKADTVSWRQLLTLDLDYVTSDPWDIVEMLLGCAAAMYSTHGHTPDDPRYRLVLPLSRPVTRDEYAAVARRVAADVGINMFDDTTYEPHRLMYWPSTPQDGVFRFETQDGPWLDVEAVLRRYADWRDPAQWPQSERRGETLRALAQKQGDPTAKPGLIGAFCRAYPVTEAIDTFLPEVYAACGERRYTYTGGSTVGGLVIYDNDTFAYSHHGTDPAGGKLCNAWDLVRIHRFGAQDADAPEDTPVGRLPSYKAMMDLCGQDEATKREAARSRIAEFDAGHAAENEDWTNLLDVDRKGNILSTIDNMVIVLEHDTRLKGRYAFDEFWERPVVLGDMPWQCGATRATPAWSDADDSGLRYHLEKYYGIEGVGKVMDAVAVAMSKTRVHPVREYLSALPPWDGTPRVDTLLIDYLGAEDSAFVRAVTRKSLVGAVARVFQPGCKHDHMLVLIGPQGTGKSTLVRKIGGQWFSDSLTTVSGKEAFELLQGAWIIEMGELAATRRADIESIKLFISKQEDTYRAAYGRRTMPHPRQCVFFGTTNDEEFLHDPTGGRRFWPVSVDQQPRKANVWEGLTEAVLGQLWAEAVALHLAGEPLFLPPELEQEARKRQERHTEGNAKLGLVENYVNTLLPENWDTLDLCARREFLQQSDLGMTPEGTVQRTRVCSLEVWCECFGGDAKGFVKLAQREINDLLKALPGWKPYTGSKDSKMRFSEYGLQRAYVRI